jgi:hypothetical protein
MRTRAAMSVTVPLCVASLLAGCGTSPSIAPASIPQNDAASNRAHKQSWMLREAKGDDLLYVNAVRPGAGSGEVLVYAYPGGKLVGTLGAFDNPAGLCSDTAGNVFVTIGGFEGLEPSVQEYAHGGRLLATLSVPGVWATSCSVDPTTGNLAVASGGTDVYIYQNAQGEPVTYSSGLANATNCAFDAAGNLFVVGLTYNRKSQLVEMPAGSSENVQTIKLDKQITPTAVQWDGADLAVGTTSANIIYRVEVSQGRAKTVSRARLVGADHSEFWISGSTLVRATDNNKKIGVWHYPEGGAHKNVLKQALSYRAYGVTVSLGAHGASTNLLH